MDINYVHTFPCVFYLAEEVSLLLSVGETGQVAADHQVRVIQHRIEPTSGGQKGLNKQDTLFTALEYMLTIVTSVLEVITSVFNCNVIGKNIEGENAISVDWTKITTNKIHIC